MSTTQNKVPEGKTQKKPCSAQRIAAELKKRFLASDDHSECTITMKADGKELTLVLCSENPDLRAMSPDLEIAAFDHVLVNGTGVAHVMGGTPDDVVRQLQAYDELSAQYRKDVETLRCFYERHRDQPIGNEPDDPFSEYSDRHKDLFGYRPRGWEFNSRDW